MGTRKKTSFPIHAAVTKNHGSVAGLSHRDKGEELVNPLGDLRKATASLAPFPPTLSHLSTDMHRKKALGKAWLRIRFCVLLAGYPKQGFN